MKNLFAAFSLFILSLMSHCKTPGSGTDANTASSQDNRTFPDPLVVCESETATCPSGLECIWMHGPGELGEMANLCMTSDNACKNECEDRPCYTEPESFARPHRIVWCQENPVAATKITNTSSLEDTSSAYSRYCPFDPSFQNDMPKLINFIATKIAEDAEYKNRADYMDAVKNLKFESVASISFYSGGLYRNLNTLLLTGERPVNARDYQCAYVAQFQLAKSLRLLPPHGNVVYRGQSSDFSLPVGSVFEFRGFMSTSRKVSVAYGFSSTQIWKIIPRQSGHWISPMAVAGESEDEVLFTPNVKLRVRKIEENVEIEGLKIAKFITLEEV